MVNDNLNDDYEILPHQELEYLRREVERLKGNPSAMEDSETLLATMQNLNANMNKLNAILESANDEMLRDYEENRTVKHMKRLEEQNEKIAEGLVTIAHLIKNDAAQTTVSESTPEPKTEPAMAADGAPESIISQEPEFNRRVPSVAGMTPPPSRGLPPLDADVPLPPQ